MFGEATAVLDRPGGGVSTVFVFLDEGLRALTAHLLTFFYLFLTTTDAGFFLFLVNTCDHMGLINEIICHRSIYGNNFPLFLLYLIIVALRLPWTLSPRLVFNIVSLVYSK